MLKRTPLRLAATFTLLFAATVIALFAILFYGLTARLTNEIHIDVEQAMNALLSVDRQRSFDDLVAVVTSESSSVRDSDFIFELVDEQGQHVAGNVRNVKYSDDWLTLERSQIEGDWDAEGEPDDRFYAIWRPVSKGRLLVGTSNGDLRQTQTFLLEVLGIGLIATTLLGALCGAFLARQTQHRIDAFANTLDAVSAGQIQARVPMSGSGDDIDHVGAQVNRTLDHLQTLIENVNQSSSDIAHDLKKPVGRLRQRLDIARRSARTTSDFSAAVEDALGDLDAMMITFDALLRITQIEAGARRARFANVDLAGVLDDVADVYMAVAEDAGHQLAWPNGRWKPATVRGDRELLIQLFANLIENAIRHCPPGTKISLMLHDEPQGFRAEVTDNGPGIPEEEREKVFRRLYRLERARSTPGSGLGLTLAAAIAELHDATIVLEDGAPGLRVMISFPAATEDA
ncbi:HAMP domain-containing sensor histidine kinase [Hyphomicrobium sp.]|uniref:HAMP domain-containing sensor histidine kinase n=1 Tax=Hyphomicrobium sp. TaxID=82 RepID=UPI002E2FDE7C|nr:HAMP domain-containing sensor histidine kinase [Hyphomicrobium sp.]HEX2842841.1 HAMP domain-containing sensor histidine kinase [Hyphomicrobium sp.]